MGRHRILIIGHTYTAPVNRLKFEHMARDRRFELLLVTPRKWRNYVTVADNTRKEGGNGYRTLFEEIWLGRHPAIYLIPRLGQIIREFKPHLIYCEQEPICWVALQAAVLSREVPIIFFSWENVCRRDWPYRLFAPIRWACYRKSRFMAAGTREAAGIMRRQGYRKPIYITPILGVSEELFSPQSETTVRQRSNSPFTVGFIGRFVPEKGVDTLMEAFGLVDRRLDWHLTLLGGGPLKTEYEEGIIAQGLGARVSFHPPVSHDQVPEFLKALDVLVLPSKTTSKWKEQFGHILIEAMACGVPVIGSDSGEIPRVIAEAGLIFREGDARDLSAKLTSLCQDTKLRQELRQRGLQRVRERFTDFRIAANMIALFEIALGLERLTPHTLEYDLA